MTEQTHDWKIGDRVVLKNNQFIAFNKPPGLAVQPDKTGDKSLLQLAEIYCKSRLYLVHRLDRPISGIMVFAKTKSCATALSEQFQQRSVRKTYLAVVKDAPPQTEGTLKGNLEKDERRNRSRMTEETDGEPAEMKYRVLGSSDNYTLLEVELITGKHHQIRAQLAAIGCPVKGDVKYGARRSNKDRSIHLHSWKLAFTHPVSGEKVEMTGALPEDPLWEAFAHLIDAND